MHTAHIAIATCCAALLVAGCDRPDHAAERKARHESHKLWEYDSDKAGKQDRDKSKDDWVVGEVKSVEHFDRIRLRGAASLHITVGAAPTVQLTGSGRRVKDVEVRGETLVINTAKSSGWFEDSDRLNVTVTVPELRELESDGAGEIHISGLNGGEQKLDLSGAHDVKAQGRLDKLTIKVAGAGNVDYTQVAAAEVDVEVKGAGNVEVNASESLDAEVNGVGAVRYTGEPKRVQSQLRGFGTIAASDKSGPVIVADASDEAQPREPELPTTPTPPPAPSTTPPAPPSP